MAPVSLTAIGIFLEVLLKIHLVPRLALVSILFTCHVPANVIAANGACLYFLVSPFYITACLFNACLDGHTFNSLILN